jgi:hypothetical protein
MAEMVDIISLIIAAFALVVSFFSYRNSKKALKDSEKAAQVSVESLIRQSISSARKDLNDFIYTISNKDSSKVNKQLLNSYMEQELNMYEWACSLYLNAKVDNERFEEAYFESIRCLFEKSGDMRKLLDKGGYNNLKMVYKETLAKYG